jgi:Na+-transporting NADH:ubiquinone oxidoreductase subunit A
VNFKVRHNTREDAQEISVSFRHGAVPPKELQELDTTFDIKQTSSSAILGQDFPYTKFELLVDEGERVLAGQSVMRDRRCPDIQFAAPTGGIVGAINRGARRSLSSLVISRDASMDPLHLEVSRSVSEISTKDLMLQSGLWTALRARPFGKVPNPDNEPKALLVTAIDTRPMAPNPALIIGAYQNQFRIGMEAIAGLTDAPVYLCKSIHSEIDFNHDAVITAQFEGLHPIGLAGSHVHVLCPIGFDNREAWTIGYQDIISLGHLIQTGSPWFQRVVSLSGATIKKPRYLIVPLGGSTREIVSGESTKTNTVFSGSSIDGYVSEGPLAFLGQQHCQVTVESSSDLIKKGLGEDNDTFIPTTDLDRLSPPGILASPFLRALAVGDIDRAKQLGALELVEEDLALLSASSSTGKNFGPLLRGILDQLHEETMLANQAK